MLDKIKESFKKKESEKEKQKRLAREDFDRRIADAKYELDIIEHELDMVRHDIIEEKNKRELIELEEKLKD